MAIVNHAKREINAKIVYYGPPGVGKTTSLRYVYDRIKPSLRGEFKTLPASGSSLLCFDFSPFEQPVIAGYRLRLHVYTLQGNVGNSAAWKMTLKGADGLIIVADMGGEEIHSFQQSIGQMRDFLGAYGVGIDSVPVVLQLNKADRSGTVDTRSVAREAGVPDSPVCPTIAIKGDGVLEAITSLSRMVMERIREREDLSQEKIVDRVQEAHPFSETIAKVSAESVTDIPTSGPVVGENLLVTVVQNLISAEEGAVRIPMDLHWQGGTKRLVVTVSVTPEGNVNAH